uniref:Glycine receptor, beta b n=1 Tax=Salmo trutta TaxID=8032 RepID=A0A673Z383_SALTR
MFTGEVLLPKLIKSPIGISFFLLCRHNILNRLLITHDPRIRPNFKGIPVEDKVNIFINSFGSIQETTMVRLLHCVLEIPPRHGSRALFSAESGAPQNKAFMCKWKFDQSIPFKKQLQLTDNNYIYLHNCGSAFSVPRLSVTLCPLDLTLFPMDTQRCKMQLESFGYRTDDLQFMWQSGDPVQMEEIALPQFDIKQEDIEYGNCTKFYAGTGMLLICILKRFGMGLQILRRLPHLHSHPVNLPGLLTCTSLASELPNVSYVKAIDIWLIACLLFGFVMLNSPKRIEAEKAKMAAKAEGKEKEAGKNNTVSGTSGTPCHVSTLQVGEIRCKKVCTSKSDLRTNDFSIVGSLPLDFELSNFDCYGKPITLPQGLSKSQAKAKKPPPPKPVIPSAAKRVDLYARALFPFSFLFFNVIYWSVYL